MIRSLLIGLVAGQRALTPLAAVSNAALVGTLPEDNGAPALLARPAVAIATLAFAAGEMLGDKMATAPDRTVLPGLAARMATGAIAGAALAPYRRRVLAGTLAAAAAAGSSFAGLAIRKSAMRRFGQVPTGFGEDALVLAGAIALVDPPSRRANRISHITWLGCITVLDGHYFYG